MLGNVLIVMPIGVIHTYLRYAYQQREKQHHAYEKKRPHKSTITCLSASIISMHLYFVFPPIGLLCILFVAVSVLLLCLHREQTART